MKFLEWLDKPAFMMTGWDHVYQSGEIIFLVLILGAIAFILGINE